MGEIICTLIETPGHTSDSISLVLTDAVFTGNTLLIRGTGRTDFQGGSSEDLYKSIWEKLFSLGEEVIFYPAHLYTDEPFITLGEAKTMNPRLQFSREEFIRFMDAYHPPKPELFDTALAENSP